MNGHPILELDHIDRNFRVGRQTLRVLRDVSLEIETNEVVCLVGESGCGKTTTGKILAGLLPPSAGDLIYKGAPVSSLQGKELKQFRRSVQIIHQDPFASLNPSHTVHDTLKFPLERHGLAKGGDDTRRKVSELLAQVDLTPPGDIIDKYPHQLSGGQRQRVSIARAMTLSPSVIVADEAVSMVDVSIRISLLNTMTRMKEDRGITFVFITHDLALARYFARDGRIAVMYLGRIVELGPTRQITHTPKHPYTRALLAALPEVDPETARQKEQMALRSEDIPSLFALPEGCSFHPRCPWFKEGFCETSVPPLTDLTDNVRVACHRLAAGEALDQSTLWRKGGAIA
jgi:peptide/nickel transport system ATP-binding protein